MQYHEQDPGPSGDSGGPPRPPDPGPGNRIPRPRPLLDARVLGITALAALLGLAAGGLAEALTRLIGLVTHLAYYHRFGTAMVAPGGGARGWAAALIPVAGGLVVGLMARFGSRAIRGHGIPEAMEQVLRNDSRIPPRLLWLKPLSAAIAIGTGGPFGAEGPIIATGGALGSLLAQFCPLSAHERKVLLAAGAAAGMTATFGSPVAAVLLAVELLLFELRPKSLIPVVLACVGAAAVRYALHGTGPVFPMPALARPGGLALALYVALGALAGLASAGVVRALDWIEETFERLPLHWMLWPALGGLAVGVVGHFVPAALGVGYDNLQRMLDGSLAGQALLLLLLAKFTAWSVALGSGTSGGTLAPLFTLGGALGGLAGAVAAALLPHAGIDPRVCALVGMAAIFAGAARTLLTAAVFAFEITQQPMGLLPLLGGCAAAYLVSAMLLRHGIMTSKLARRGLRVPAEYPADHLDQEQVGDYATRAVATLAGDATVAAARRWVAQGGPETAHPGFPVLDPKGRPLGMLLARTLREPALDTAAPLASLFSQPAPVVHATHSLREAADHMVREGVGRLPVVDAEGRLIGILTRSDLLRAHGARLRANQPRRPGLALPWLSLPRSVHDE